MVFEEIFDRVDGRRLRVVCYPVEDFEACERIIDYVGAEDVAIEYATDETVPASTVVVRNGTETLSVDDIDVVATYIDSWESTMGGVPVGSPVRFGFSAASGDRCRAHNSRGEMRPHHRRRRCRCRA